MALLMAEIQKVCPISLRYCKTFDQSWCDTMTKADGTPLSKERPYFLKTLATLFNSPNGLRNTGAGPENTLLINDSSYKNVRNNRWNAVHRTPFIRSYPQRLLGYLERELMPWLRHLKDSSQTVPDFCRKNPGFGTARLQEGDAMFTAMAHATISEKMVLRARV